MGCQSLLCIAAGQMLCMSKSWSARTSASGSWVPWSQHVTVPSRSKHGRGKRPANASLPAPLGAPVPKPILDGRHPGCVEIFRRYSPVCMFDSKMALAHSHRRYHLFVRANLAPNGGSRFVQVASSVADDPYGPYGSFRFLNISGYSHRGPGNVYMAAVREHPLDERMLLGLFAVNEGRRGSARGDGVCYIALSHSCDGVHWARFTPLLHTTGQKGRTLDQPVSGFVRRGPNVHVYIHRDVPQISPAAPATSRLVRYSFRTSKLRELMAAAGGLAGCAR